ncbi:MAG: putative protease YhbU precursor [Betaproteobacteria bacterium ADurb.Bin341]|nr:MAG: putative protease YhbU precursor [Betaproteobacteria bacterium ADurb.Bin341]
MPCARKPLELLSPARDLATGIEAIKHGADAVYIGGPRFGARQAVGNSISDIAQLAEYAHRFNAHVYVALNTLLRDDELEAARQLAWQVFEAGVDALILQDMGLLELDLPPIALHASTQTDNRSPEKVRFLEAVGFSQIVLARELSLEEIRAIAAQTTARLEFFIHGALCVSYSGQCYLSHALTGRSANRGECAQLCRLPYTLSDGEGQVIARDQHLLSLKDNDQSANLRELADAGISSFKIEGRLKDMGYLKNITAHYRRLLDQLLEETPQYRRASAGRCTFLFTPQPEKSFNRGHTDYFLHGRQRDIGAFLTPKFAGEEIGTVTRVGAADFDIKSAVVLKNGDGLSYFNAAGELNGLRVNRVEGQRIIPAEAAKDLQVGTVLYRNHDQEFSRQLEKKSAERRIALRLVLSETREGFCLTATDEEGVSVSTTLALDKQSAQNPGQVAATLRDNLGKLGNTDFVAQSITLQLSGDWFIPASAQNALRRQALAALEAARQQAYQRPARLPAEIPAPRYPQTELDYSGNVLNQSARDFYTRHGVTRIEPAYESNCETGVVALMTTRHCLRYSFNLCPKQARSIIPEPLYLTRGKDQLTLRFDCQRCEMRVEGLFKPNTTTRGSEKQKR